MKPSDVRTVAAGVFGLAVESAAGLMHAVGDFLGPLLTVLSARW